MLPLNMRKALLTALVSAYPDQLGGQGPSNPNGPMGSVGAYSGSGDLTDIGRGFRMAGGAADAFRRAADAAKGDGVDLYGINNTYRSVEQQQGLWNTALKKYGSEAAARKWVAPPGKSDHNRGTAIDFSSQPAMDWMKRRGGEFGYQNYAPEPWHYSWKG